MMNVDALRTRGSLSRLKLIVPIGPRYGLPRHFGPIEMARNQIYEVSVSLRSYRNDASL